MSGLVAVVDGAIRAGETEARQLVERLLHGMGRRGAVGCVWVGDGVALGVVRHAWEREVGRADDEGVLVTDECAVVADAALYYRAELRAALAAAGVRVSGDSVARLLAAAYLAWGDAMASRLEGDFAFAVWDRRRRRLVCARDFVGRRPLVHAAAGSAYVVASTASAALAHPACDASLDLGAIGLVAAGLLEAPEDTGYTAVRTLAAGRTLVVQPPRPPQLSVHWEAPTFERGATMPFDEAAAELRAVLARATAERLAPSGSTGVWLSGGWDSTAVFAAAQQSRAGRVAAVSMSYPVGDGGREDDTIARVATHWGAPVHWTGVEGVPLVGDPGGGADRDTPFAHVYEHWNRHLARRTRDAGARVALDGAGGDQFFQVSPVYLADLAARGRWTEMLRERRARALPRRSLAHWALLPLLPAWGPRLLGALRGGAPLRAHDERRVPPWIRDEFARRHALHAYARPPRDRRAGESRSARESRWYLTTPYGPRVLGAQAAVALEEGVELRSPLYDARVIALAATRPREERSAGGETKRLLRAAGRGLLPDAVLAPRATRTGMTSHYFRRTLCAELPALVHMTRTTCLLADLGVADPHALALGAERYLHAGGAELGVALILTFQTELWLRARLDDDAWALSAPTFTRAEPRALRVSA